MEGMARAGWQDKFRLAGMLDYPSGSSKISSNNRLAPDLPVKIMIYNRISDTLSARIGYGQ
jgi:hypothetical protein